MRDYAEVTREHEMKFTARFEGLGFTWDSYIDPGKFAALTPYPMLYAPMELLRDTPCPVFKRRSFFLDFDFYFDQTPASLRSSLSSMFAIIPTTIRI